jgi:AcrR family transcriptional regulator
VKNTNARHVQRRTSSTNRPETGDRRVQRTTASLRDALIGLAREKPYALIAVKEILDRANVGRSTFYTHFRDKDDLLESSIYEMLRSIRSRPLSGTAPERIIAFSLPLLQQFDEHRRSDRPKMTREGRVAMHEHLQEVLTILVAEDLAIAASSDRTPRNARDLVARHVAATFALVVDWWIEVEPALTPMEVNARFRALVLPTLTTMCHRAGDGL